MKYGYIIRAATGKGMSDSAVFKILTESGEKTVLTGRESILFNGTKESAASVIGELLKTGNSGTEEQIIRYATDSEGLIYAIETARSSAVGLSKTEERFHQSASYANGYRGFSAKTVSGDKTVMFSVPEKPESSEMLYNVITKTSTENVNFKAYNIKTYEITADAIVVYTPGGGKVSGVGGGPGERINQDSLPATVTEVFTTLNKDGFPVKSVKILQNTGWPYRLTEFSYIAADNGAWENISGDENIEQCGDNLNVGDVIMYSLNSSGEIGRIRRLYNGNTKTIDASNGGGTTNPIVNNSVFHSPIRLLDSYAFKTEDNFIMVSSVPITSDTPDREKLEVYNCTLAEILIVENIRGEAKVRKGSMSEIRSYEIYGSECDRILISTNWGTLINLVAIRSDV